MKRKKIYWLIGILTLLFIILSILVIIGNTKALDDSIYQAIFSLRNNSWDKFFINITTLGNPVTVVLIVCIIELFLKKKDRILFPITIINTFLLNQIMKHIIVRPRPEHLRLVTEKGYSYPSGHAMISIALYGFLIYWVYHNIENKLIKRIIITLLTLLILGIGCSRIYVGVHYPSDIIGGYLLSSVILLSVIEYSKNHFKGASK